MVTDVVFGFLNLAVYYYISKTLRPGMHAGFDGAPSYFAFAAVGVSLTVVLQGAVVGVSRRLREEQLTGTLEALLVQPISTSELALGLTGFPFVFAMARAFVYLLLGAVFLGLSFGHCDWLGLLVSFLVSGAAFTALGISLAGIVLVFKRADAVGALGSFALAMLGGAFFATRVLPAWLHPVADVVPTRYAFAAVRAALFGGQSWGAPVLTLLALALATMGLGLGLFALSVKLVVRRGTLNQY